MKLSGLIPGETGPERAKRYKAAILIVQSLDEQQWTDFEHHFEVKTSIAEYAKKQRQSNEAHKATLSKFRHQRAMIGSLQSINQEVRDRLKAAEHEGARQSKKIRVLEEEVTSLIQQVEEYKATQ